MDVEWDHRKAASNRKKHGIEFEEAATVLYDEMAITLRSDDAGETRFVTLGAASSDKILVVVYTCRGDRPRLISARKATAKERRQYEG